MKFITDVKNNEPEILAKVANETLMILCLHDNSVLFEYTPPSSGWTHEALCSLDIPLKRLEAANAYLGNEWVGSTEI